MMQGSTGRDVAEWLTLDASHRKFADWNNLVGAAGRGGIEQCIGEIETRFSK